MDSTLELLVYATEEITAETVARALQAQGLAVDSATTLERARGLFLERGGHALLLIASDVGTGRAREVIEALRGVDDGLTVVVFGNDVLRDVPIPNLQRIKSFHPGSRAGVGAIRKLLYDLPQA